MTDRPESKMNSTPPPPAPKPIEPSRVVKAERREQNPRARYAETWGQSTSNWLDDWLAIEPDGTVTVLSGKVELGTGVRTALAQIVAEELDVPFERIKMVMGNTGRTPNEGYTAGSKTIQFGGVALREAAAEARRALLEMASDRLDAMLDELEVRDGTIVVRDYPTRTITYAELMGGKKFNREMTGKAPHKPPEQYRIVGTPVPRVDIPRKLTGQPSFIQDVRVPGMLHGRVVRPPSYGAQLVSLDANSVRDARVIRLNNFVGVVAAREAQALRAAQELKVGWAETTQLPPMDELYEALRREPANEQVVVERGEVEGALARAPRQLHATYLQPFQAHASLGPSCAVADFRADGVTVWCSTQGVYPLRGALAQLLELPPEQVRVIHVEGAGCYGHNGFDDVAADAVILSRAVGYPVRVQWSREDEFKWEPYAPAMVMDLRGGLDERGRVIAWDYNCWSPTHAARPRAGIDFIAGQLIAGQPPPARTFFLGGDRNAPTNYTFANQRVTMHWLAHVPLRASSYRSLGGAANTLANESFVDELAAAAQLDPLEFRLRHLDDPRAREVLQTAAEHAGWGTPLPPNEGRGLAFAQYENSEAYVATVAHVAVAPASGEVRVRRLVVAHDCGLIVNPNGVRNQIEGNVIQSLSRALKEEVTFDPTRITSVDWDSYPILKFSEVPEVEVILLNRPDQSAVGAGEPATITTAAAVANAIFNATGARVRQVPFTPKRVRTALNAR
jgi:nicotinate dehydrogenase subunit B